MEDENPQPGSIAKKKRAIHKKEPMTPEQIADLQENMDKMAKNVSAGYRGYGTSAPETHTPNSGGKSPSRLTGTHDSKR